MQWKCFWGDSVNLHGKEGLCNELQFIWSLFITFWSICTLTSYKTEAADFVKMNICVILKTLGHDCICMYIQQQFYSQGDCICMYIQQQFYSQGLAVLLTLVCLSPRHSLRFEAQSSPWEWDSEEKKSETDSEEKRRTPPESETDKVKDAMVILGVCECETDRQTDSEVSRSMFNLSFSVANQGSVHS